MRFCVFGRRREDVQPQIESAVLLRIGLQVGCHLAGHGPARARAGGERQTDLVVPLEKIAS
jgi:hypothetical protein